MNGDKQIGFVVIGELSTVFELHKNVAITGHQHPYTGLFVQEFLELKTDLQRNVLFGSSLQAACTRVFSPVAGIYHDGRVALLPWGDGLSDWKARRVYRSLSVIAREVFKANGWGDVNHQARWIGEHKLFIAPE